MKLLHNEEYLRIGEHVFDHGYNTIRNHLLLEMVEIVHKELFTTAHFKISPVYSKIMSKLRNDRN